MSEHSERGQLSLYRTTVRVDKSNRIECSLLSIPRDLETENLDTRDYVALGVTFR